LGKTKYSKKSKKPLAISQNMSYNKTSELINKNANRKNSTLKKFEADHLGASRALILARCEKTIVSTFL
jgi:hypothetical protein